ncbi:hypothetical protein EQV77_14945 [Halobacillus fulvus]|nr:hypothetical protein EQV77_14945 [Halobacillus fulvus]
MNHNQAIEVLETISELYPRKFDITERVAKILIPKLLKMDFDGVIGKLSDYAVSNPFPPTVSDIAVYPPEENRHLERMKEWEEEAAEVSDEVRKLFLKKLNSLAEEKSDES